MAEQQAHGSETVYAEPELVPVDHVAEEVEARRLATRYQLEFVDLEQFHIDHALFRSIPADLMLRYGFVPYRRDGNTLLIVVSDPRDLQTIDEVCGHGQKSLVTIGWCERAIMSCSRMMPSITISGRGGQPGT